MVRMIARLRVVLESLSRTTPVARQADAWDRQHGTLDVETLRRVVWEIASVHEQEISCEECFQRMDHLVELEIAGQGATQSMTLVQEHLACCDDCREEFEALLAALRGPS
jgi:hypothetical protein